MDPWEKYAHWEDIALYDLGTAEAMFQSGRYLYVVFMCQQAIEKIAKGLFVLYTDREAPRTHNIHLIMRTLFDEGALASESAEYDRAHAPFFAELLAYYISERYPSYREKLSASVSGDKAKDVLERTKGVFVWLQSLKRQRTRSKAM